MNRTKYWAIATATDQSNETFVASDGAVEPRTAISQGDKVILFQRQRDDILFVHTATITSVDSAVLDGERRSFTVHWAETQPLEQRPHLSTYAYSLQKIYRFSRPSIHFRRRYVALTEYDYETLRQSRLHSERTVAGILLSAVPFSVRVSYLKLIADGEISSYGSLALSLVRNTKSSHQEFARLVIECRALESALVSEIPTLRSVEIDGETGPVSLASLGDAATEFLTSFSESSDPFTKILAVKVSEDDRSVQNRALPFTRDQIIQLMELTK